MPSPAHEPKPKMATMDRHQSLPCQKTCADSEETYFDPPESFWVSKGDEYDWFDRNAIIQRKSSRKFSFSATPTHLHHHQAKPVSHRPSLSSSNHKSKASFIGLPMAQKSPFHNGNHRQHKAGNVCLFRSRSEQGGRKLTVQAAEPASPQVNCLGRVGTKKERPKKIGLWQSIATALKTGFRAHVMAETVTKNTVSTKERGGSTEPRPVAPGLAGLKRLESGRRSEASSYELKQE